MKIVLDRCSIVIVGAWNLAIFNPEWVGKRLLADEPEYQLGFDVAPGAGAMTHYKTSKIWLAASAGKLEFKPMDDVDKSFAAIEEAARTVLSLLPETPIAACGINFGFDAEVTTPIAKALEISDADLLQRASAKVSSTRIARTVTFAGTQFNFTIEHGEDSAVIRIDFNHHHPVRSGQEALKLLNGTVTKSRDVSRRFLHEVYMNRKEGEAL